MSFGVVKLFLLALSAGVGLVWAVAALRRALRKARRWKRSEPGLVREIETVTGQRVEFRLKLNASRTPDFTHRDIFWVWLACTRDHLVLVYPDEIGENGSAHLFLTARKKASLRRLDNHYAELVYETPSPAGSATLTLLVRPCDYESLARCLHR